MKDLSRLSDDDRLRRALAHPLRVEILRLLDQGVAGPADVAKRTGCSVPTCSYHFNVLADLGLIARERAVQRRGTIKTLWSVRQQCGEPLATFRDVSTDLSLDDSGLDELERLVQDFEAAIRAVQEKHPGRRRVQLQVQAARNDVPPALGPLSLEL